MALLKLAIVGGGPSAFYVASRLLQLLPQTHLHAASLRIHIYDRLWAPHGLVRYGVAPDHPEVKNCTNKFDAAAQDPRLSFFGNVNVGAGPCSIPHAVNIPLESLFPHYTHLLLASGCPVPRQHPALPPSPLCIPALSLVHWYTLHPSAPPAPPLEKTAHVTLVGHGNVALDAARILLSPPDRLTPHDVPAPVLALLACSAVRHVSIIGRRGPYEARFSTKELREMLGLPGTALAPLDQALLAPPPGAALSRPQARLLALLREGSQCAPGTTQRTWSLDFFRSPTGLAPAPASTGHAATLALAHTALDATQHATPTGASSALPTDLVVPSLGYTTEAAPAAWHDAALGHVRAAGGRVFGARAQLARVYASGWAATGARGVLAATLLDAQAVAGAMLADHFPAAGAPAGAPDVERVMAADPPPDAPPPEVVEARRVGLVTDYADWRAVDAEEVRRGRAVGKERERMAWADAHAFLASRAP